MSNTFKIAHAISRAGLMSRRCAEVAVESSRVSVNGDITLNCALRVSDDDRIMVDGHEIARTKSRLFMFNKPPMYVVSHVSQGDKRSIFDIIRSEIYLTYVGRLDYLSQGILLLTNDPQVAHELTTSTMRRVYSIIVDSFPKALINFLQNPVVDGIALKKIDLISVDEFEDVFQLRIGLYEGKNREIRRICSLFGMKIYKLERISYGPYTCNIPLGYFKEIDLIK